MTTSRDKDDKPFVSLDEVMSDMLTDPETALDFLKEFELELAPGEMVAALKRVLGLFPDLASIAIPGYARHLTPLELDSLAALPQVGDFIRKNRPLLLHLMSQSLAEAS